MHTFESFLDDVRTIVTETDRLLLDHASKMAWIVSDGFLPIVYRAVLRRQNDALASMVELCRQKMGYAAVAFLRPACEELIWIKYLGTLQRVTAEKLIQAILGLETFELLHAQAAFCGPEIMSRLGLDAWHLKYSTHVAPGSRAMLKALAKELGWPAAKRRPLPTARYLARRVGLADIYSFLYHASSRFVHFSVVELVRRAWGKPGDMSIGSSTLEPYWSTLSLAWGVRLYMDVLVELGALFDNARDQQTSFDGPRVLEAARRIGEFGMVPIISAEELYWPE